VNANPIRVAVGLGGNLGDRSMLMSEAAAAMLVLPTGADFRFSSIYETKAVDCREPLPFLNAAITFETRLKADELLAALQEIETALGRSRPYRNAPRPIDLDLLLYGEDRIQRPELTVPHPRLHERLFALEPLAEIWPEARHPELNRSVAELVHAQRARRSPEDVIAKSRDRWKIDHFM